MSLMVAVDRAANALGKDAMAVEWHDKLEGGCWELDTLKTLFVERNENSEWQSLPQALSLPPGFLQKMTTLKWVNVTAPRAEGARRVSTSSSRTPSRSASEASCEEQQRTEVLRVRYTPTRPEGILAAKTFISYKEQLCEVEFLAQDHEGNVTAVFTDSPDAVSVGSFDEIAEATARGVYAVEIERRIFVREVLFCSRAMMSTRSRRGER